jgi:hypothetical protein
MVGSGDVRVEIDPRERHEPRLARRERRAESLTRLDVHKRKSWPLRARRVRSGQAEDKVIDFTPWQIRRCMRDSAPLWPAGHLPHGWGDWPIAAAATPHPDCHPPGNVGEAAGLAGAGQSDRPPRAMARGLESLEKPNRWLFVRSRGPLLKSARGEVEVAAAATCLHA